MEKLRGTERPRMILLGHIQKHVGRDRLPGSVVTRAGARNLALLARRRKVVVIRRARGAHRHLPGRIPDNQFSSQRMAGIPDLVNRGDRTTTRSRAYFAARRRARPGRFQRCDASGCPPLVEAVQNIMKHPCPPRDSGRRQDGIKRPSMNDGIRIDRLGPHFRDSLNLDFDRSRCGW